MVVPLTTARHRTECLQHDLERLLEKLLRLSAGLLQPELTWHKDSLGCTSTWPGLLVTLRAHTTGSSKQDLANQHRVAQDSFPVSYLQQTALVCCETCQNKP